MITFGDLVGSRYEMNPWDYDSNKYKFSYCAAGHPNSYYERGYSDIVAHLPMLEFLASHCEHVTEFGFRNANSAVALIKGCKGKVISYDIERTPEVDLLLNMQLPCDWEFRQRSTIDPELLIDKTDFLFIDTLHTYNQVQRELYGHSCRVDKYIGLHDTTSCPEVYRAVQEFLKTNGYYWKEVYKVNYCHGLTILARTW